MKTRLIWILGVLVVIFVALQFTNPSRTNPPVVHDFLAAETPPPPIAALFRGACYDCHSYETQWPWYSHIAPVSWLIANDVQGGRRHLNFSNWPVDDPERAAKRLENASEELGYKEMPPAKYQAIHPASRLTTDQRQQLIQWLDSEAKRLKTVATSGK
ncbi:MAG TPA: heme-binding domain-containing protein [Verrucomicrobiae bacterium]|nr:heme-binding domain-containing protein [Verrucomicrobiae bacterium]